MGKNILITGGCGFIGSKLAVRLLSHGHNVIILDSLISQVHGENPELESPTYNVVKSLDVNIMIADINDRKSVKEALRDIDTVYHLASETGTGQSMYKIVDYIRTNVQGTATLLEAISESPSVKKIFLSSSRSVYGEGSYECSEHGFQTLENRDWSALDKGIYDPQCSICFKEMSPIPTNEASPLNPNSIYAYTKLSQENLLRTFCKNAKIKLHILRFQNVYGGGQSLKNPYTGILSIFNGLIRTGKTIQIFEDGQESRDFIHVDDVVSSILALDEKECSETVINIGSGRRTNVKDILQLLERSIGQNANSIVTGEYRIGDIRHNYADVKILNKYIDTSSFKSIEKGIFEFIDWASQGDIDNSAERRYQDSLDELRKNNLLK